VWGPAGSVCSTHGQHTVQARPGHHLAPAVLSTGRNVFEQLGPGYTLIALTDQARPATAFQTAAQALGMPLRVLADTFAGPRTAYGSRFTLVRPDQYVAWTGDDLPADPAAVLRRVAGG
jgi:4-hydroxyisophthalate hydroxylase